ncbi:F-box only protein 25 isoform X2 [Genypterus blacodes]|uniref:F-box only protein 25 isoform X2 n=1 Tax=Genypterus blacodes TaxID=154954 RepID=UPI003F7649D5
MPFLGKDWRSPGWTWAKTEHGWKRIVFYGQQLEDYRGIDFEELCDDGKENLFVGDVCDLNSAKRKKDFYNNTTKSQFVYRDKWVFVQRDSTKERNGYSTLGEALNRLDFSSHLQDMRRFEYVAKLFQLIAKSQLPTLSGAAQKNYFNTLEKIVRKVLDDQYNPRLIKDLLRDLSLVLHRLIVDMGNCVLVGNANIWVCRQETIHSWQQQLNNLQIPKQVPSTKTFNDLPLNMQSKIFDNLSDAYDIINLGQATPTLQVLSENKTLWKKLCHFHFSDKPYCKNLVLNKSDNVDWKMMYFTLQKHYPRKEFYSDTLHFCKHCSIVFWKDGGHPCTAVDPATCFTPVSPQHFIDLFKF